MYNLITDSGKNRTYRSDVTGSEVTTSLLYTSPHDGEKFWAFDDLFQIPVQRKIASQRVTDLFGSGITSEELKAKLTALKTILKSTDTEKYEKAYSEILTLETNLNFTENVAKQAVGLCSVYILNDTERIDIYNQQIATAKIDRWVAFEDEQAFFLTWLMDTTAAFQQLSTQITQIASAIPKIPQQQDI